MAVYATHANMNRTNLVTAQHLLFVIQWNKQPVARIRIPISDKRVRDKDGYTNIRVSIVANTRIANSNILVAPLVAICVICKQINLISD